MNVLNATESYVLKWSLLCDVNFASIFRKCAGKRHARTEETHVLGNLCPSSLETRRLMLRKEGEFGGPKYLCECLPCLLFDQSTCGILKALPFSGHSGLGHKSVKVFAYLVGAGN